MIKVLIVEDSPVVREFLIHLFSSEPGFEASGAASDGQEALEFLRANRPDVITMDINMPRMNGFEATRKIMETYPTPIVIVSGSWDTQEVATTFRAVEAGALAVVARPRGIGHPEHEATVRELIQTVKLMAEVKVVRRWPRSKKELGLPSTPPVEVLGTPGEIQVVAIGASTGGPLVLRTILSSLAEDFLVPVLIVQHMAAGFIQGFVEWLGQSTRFPIQVAVDGQPLLPRHAYMAPDGLHMGVDSHKRISLRRGEPENGLRPSVCNLFRSVAHVFGRNAAGVLLTGMGKDGAEGLKLMRESGATTFAQDEESSVVHGMPGEAIRLGAAQYVFSPEGIAQALRHLVIRRDV